MVKLLNDNFIAHKKKILRADDSVYLLLTYFFTEANHFLSKEDIRQDVMFDDDASEGAIRQLIYKTRKWLKKHDLPLEIVNITRKGYKLTKLGKLQQKKS
jgi:DNA-binding winged helix-turn-helix (wHTH) protein